MNPITYLQPFAQHLLDVGKTAFAKQGRGALVIFPQEPGQTEGQADVKYHPLAWWLTDDDPLIPVIQTYNPETHALIVVAMTFPKEIYSYLTDGQTLAQIEHDTLFVLPPQPLRFLK